MTAKQLWKEKIDKGLNIWGHPNGQIWASIKLEYPDRKKEWIKRSLGTDSKTVARIEAIKLQSVLQERTERGQSVKKLYVHDYVDKFMAWKEARSKEGKLTPQRFKIYQTTFNRWFNPWISHKRVPVAEVTQEIMQEYRLFREWYPESEQWALDLAEKKRKKESTQGFAQMKTPSDGYMREELKRIKEMFNWCVAENIISQNQIPRFPEIDVDSETSEGFSVPEFNMIERHMLKEWIPDAAGNPIRSHERERVHLKMIVLITTGCRVGDLSQLLWEDVYPHYNSHKKVEEYYMRCKSKVANARDLSIPEELFDLFMNWKDKSKFQDAKDFVFGTKESNAQTASIDAGLWKRVLLDLGLWLDVNGRRRTLTANRHTFATWGILRGIPVDDLCHRMRTSRAEFEKTYLDNMPKHDAERYARSVRPDGETGFSEEWVKGFRTEAEIEFYNHHAEPDGKHIHRLGNGVLKTQVNLGKD